MLLLSSVADIHLVPDVQVSVMFGTFLSAWVAVTSPVLVSMLGLDLLTTGFGTLTFVRGCAALLGTYGLQYTVINSTDFPLLSYTVLGHFIL